MSQQRVPVFKISLTNATLLSALYLLVASAVELIRRVWNPRWVERVSLSMEAFPARTLELLGLFQPLLDAYRTDALTGTQVRLLYGLTTVIIIFALGMAVGVLMWLIGKLASRSPASKT